MKGLFVPLLVMIVLLGTTPTSIHAEDIFVPSVHEEIYVAIQYARPDTDRVIVETNNSTYEPFTMKSGVPVLAAAGPAPIIDAGAAQPDRPANDEGPLSRGGCEAAAMATPSGMKLTPRNTSLSPGKARRGAGARRGQGASDERSGGALERTRPRRARGETARAAPACP